jgi:hypothetical protein
MKQNCYPFDHDFSVCLFVCLFVCMPFILSACVCFSLCPDCHFFRTFFFLWLYSQILGLGRLHETFRLISVTTSRTVGRTPWTGDQLVARPLRVCPEWLWWRNWWNEWFRQGKPKYSEKTKHVMEPEVSIPCSQEPSTGPYPEPYQSNPLHPILSLSDPF